MSNSALLATAILVELIYLLLFLLTLKRPGLHFWPPPRLWSWQFFAAWLLAGYVGLVFLLLGVLDLNSGFLPGIWLRLPFVLALFLCAWIIGAWTATVFGLRHTLGLGTRLVTGGPYRYTRNPQYICDSLQILGYMLLTNSWMVWIIGALGVLLNVMAPRVEEPWLEERFGDEYRAYKRRVPRFFGRPRL